MYQYSNASIMEENEGQKDGIDEMVLEGKVDEGNIQKFIIIIINSTVIIIIITIRKGCT